MLVHGENISLILLDLMLPGRSGEDIILELKQKHNIPIIVMSAIHDINKKVDLFALGADDYITKPFHNDELLARIQARLRTDSTPAKSETLFYKDIEINKNDFSAKCAGKSIDLSRHEFALLCLLMENPNHTCTKSFIYDTVWDYENSAFFGGLTAYQNLKYYALQKGIVDMGQIDEALSLVNLSDVKNKKFRTFSLGMKQRLGIAFAMLDNPDLIILDEPINGLDPIGISQMRETFQKLNSERGITFMISSHILSELYTVANRFLFIDNGRVLKEITKEELDIECAKCVVLKTGDTKHCTTIIEKMVFTTTR